MGQRSVCGWLVLEKYWASEATGMADLCEDKLGSNMRRCPSPLYLDITDYFSISFVFPFFDWFLLRSAYVIVPILVFT